MLDYTVESVNKTVNDLKRIFYIFSASVQALCIVYLVYLLVIGEGFFAANIILLVLSTSHFVFHTICYGNGGKARRKLLGIKNVLRYAKLAIRAITLGVAIYGIYVATTHLTPVSIILTSLMAVCWILQIIFEFVCYFVESRATLIINAMKRDAESVISPIRSVGSFVKRAAGYESPQREPIDVPEWLDERVAKRREERRCDKALRKREAKLRRHRAAGVLLSRFKKRKDVKKTDAVVPSNDDIIQENAEIE